MWLVLQVLKKMSTLIGILYFFHLFQNYLLKVLRKISNMFLNQPPSFYTADNPLFWDSSFICPQTLSYKILLLCSPCPHHASSSFFFFVLSSPYLQFLMFCLQLSAFPLSPLASITAISPNQSFQVISAPAFLLKSSASLATYFILNCKFTFQKTTVLDHKHSIHPLIFLFKVPHGCIWQFL